MSKVTPYFFESDRIGFRQWTAEDLAPYAVMNADPKVMEFFPTLYSETESKGSIARHTAHIDNYGFGYFAIDDLASGKFMGFLGCCWQDFEHPESPFVDIGWRLAPEFWGKGLATEGAKAVQDFMIKFSEIKNIYSVAPSLNMASINVMKKIGMSKVDEFAHPLIPVESPLNLCSLYKVANETI